MILQSIAEYKNKISNNLDPLRSEFLLNVGELYDMIFKIWKNIF